MEAAPLLELAIKKELKTFRLEAELSLRSDQGQVLVLFGPSGSGKTMTLRCIAGVTDPDAGFIKVGGRTVFDSQRGLSVKLPDRRVGYLPQNYSLFPHLNVTQNVAFGLFNWEKKRAEKRVRELLNLLQLTGLEKRYPRELSGGQQQRVAFARALAPEPSILLLDEPFSALDAAIRAELRQNLALLSRQLELPVVFITHDLEEAFMLGDRIAVYNQGRILQYGSREAVFYRPATREVARLVGIRNLWEGRVLASQSEKRLAQVRTIFGDLWAKIPEQLALPEPGSTVTVCLRPERVNLRPFTSPETNETLNRYCGQLIGEVGRGSLYTLFFRPVAEPPATLNLPVSHSTGPKQTSDLELEISAQHYIDLKRTNPALWEVLIDPAALHLIPSP
jgi:molybdate transport system ATP-binding protein